MPKTDEKENLSFVIVGHVDHGKSTLIGRLLFDTDSLKEGKLEEIKKICEQLGREVEFAFVMDHLEEERTEAITIDTAQTFFSTEERDYVIIDAPGHKEFVKNMITGASQAEAALIIVDVKEGVAEQTRRHAYILSMLNIKQVVVLLNKMDLVGYEQQPFIETKEKILTFLHEIGISPKFVIPISAKEGDNIVKRSKMMFWYDGPTLLEALNSLEPAQRPVEQPFRMAVQDVYNFNYRRIVVGRVESGRVRPGDEVVVLPSGERAVVKSVELYLKPLKFAESGLSIGVSLATEKSPKRGDLLSDLKDRPVLVKRIRTHIFWLDEEPLKRGEVLTLRCATQERRCRLTNFHEVFDSSTLRVLRQESETLNNTEVADVTIDILSDPIVMEEFGKIAGLGRFVLERDGKICAGGVLSKI